MAILDTAEFFSKTLIPTVGGRGSNRRVPFTFTSTRRLLATGAAGVATSRELSKFTAKQQQDRLLKAIDQDRTAIDVASTVGLSAALSATSSMPVISMMVNPNSVKWTQSKRYTKRDTMNGSVFFHFANEYGQNNDILTLQFSGTTGNINTQNGLLNSAENGADLKLRIWHELYALSREPMLLSEKIGDQQVLSGVRNDFFLTYRTVLMPIPITFIGFFNNVLEFTESADKPYTRDYSFGFTVTATSPSLDDLTKRLNNALTNIGPLSAASGIL